MPINIVLADDHALVRDGIKSLLEDEADLKVIGEAGNGEEALEVAASISAGAHGYLLKDASREEFIKAIHTVTKGEKYFTVETHRYKMMETMGVNNKGDLIKRAQELGLL